jgi:hypothetical protein
MKGSNLPRVKQCGFLLGECPPTVLKKLWPYILRLKTVDQQDWWYMW